VASLCLKVKTTVEFVAMRNARDASLVHLACCCRELAQWRAASTCTSYLYLKLPVNVVGKMSKTAVPPLCHHCVSILVFFFVHLTRKTTTNTLCSSFHINVSPFSKQPTCLKTELCVAACVSSTFTSPVRSVSRLVVRRVAWLS